VSEGTASQSGRRLDKAALAIGAFLVALAVVIAWDAAHMRTGVASYSRVGPRAFPYAIAIGLVVLGVLTVLEGMRSAGGPRERDEWAPVAWIVGGLLAQIALLPYLGFSIATGAVFAATAGAFGRRRIWISYPLGVVFSLLVWLFFAKALKLVLPAGPLERLF
jgi:putative tricarboxylic transport membrane protein